MPAWDGQSGGAAGPARPIVDPGAGECIYVPTGQTQGGTASVDYRVEAGFGRRWRVGALITSVAAFLAGCSSSGKKYCSPLRLDRGYTIVLPGVEGRSFLNRNIARGLVQGGVPSGIEVYDWTMGGWLTVPLNLRYLERNREQARKIALKIIAYQDRHPGQPVHLVGHSGGGGVAVLALEALPAGRKITSAILLAPALNPEYDLRRALTRTQYGIYNFYSPYDVGWLKAGTTVMGTIDGKHTTAAGAIGFREPWGLSDEDRRLYRNGLHQQVYSQQMAESGHSGGHMGWANTEFVAEWLAPILISQMQHGAYYAADEAAPAPRPR
jgi:pimeloyl-ACP methyl ester carboxylesterase